jgi:MarR family transcriptional regulator, organic hydroperoxide resistance regulator
MRLIWAIGRSLVTTSGRMHRTLGVSGPQRLVIRILGTLPGSSPRQVAEILHVGPGRLTGALRRLEKDGLVTRRTDPLDRRRVTLWLTARGLRLDVPARGTIEEAVERALSGLSRNKIEAGRMVLMALAASLTGKE